MSTPGQEHLDRAMADYDPLDSLQGIVLLRRLLESRERFLVELAREQGKSWTAIGEAAGIDRQHSRLKFHVRGGIS